MHLFETRNVFDRIEDTGKIFFSKNWKISLIPPMLVGIVSAWVMLILVILGMGIFAPLVGVPDITVSPQYPVMILSAMGLFLFVLTIGSLVIAWIQLYVFYSSQNDTDGMTWRDIARWAMSLLGSWVMYYLWMFVVLLIVIGCTTILWLIDTTFLFLFIPITLAAIWFFVSTGAGLPGYVLEKKKWLHDYFSLVHLTRHRWWYVFGNLLLVGVVIGSVLGTVQNLLFFAGGGNDIMAWITTVFSQPDPQIPSFSASDISIFSWIQYAFGYTLLLVLYYGQRIFTYTFQYVLWKDLTTPAPVVTSENILEKSPS